MDIVELARSAPGIHVDRGQLLDVIKAFGLNPPKDSKALEEARDFAGRLTGHGTAPLEAYQLVEEKTGLAVLTCHEDDQLTGVGAFILLSEAGKHAVLNHEFDANMPAAEHLASAGERIYANYAWGGSATTKQAKRLVVGIDAFLEKAYFEPIPVFARAVTDDGARALTTHLGYKPITGTDLFCRPPALVEA